MYIHIGGKRAIRSEGIIGVFDLDGSYKSEDNIEFLKTAQRHGMTSSADDDLPRTFVLTDDEVIFTHISTSAIKNRTFDK